MQVQTRSRFHDPSRARDARKPRKNEWRRVRRPAAARGPAFLRRLDGSRRALA